MASRVAARLARRAAGPPSASVVGNTNRLVQQQGPTTASARRSFSSSATSGSSSGGSNTRSGLAGAAAVGAGAVLAATAAAAAGTALAVAEGSKSEGGGGGGGGGGSVETGGGAWGRRGMSQGKYSGLKKGEAGEGETVQGEDDKFFDPDYEYLMVRLLIYCSDGLSIAGLRARFDAVLSAAASRSHRTGRGGSLLFVLYMTWPCWSLCTCSHEMGRCVQDGSIARRTRGVRQTPKTDARRRTLVW